MSTAAIVIGVGATLIGGINAYFIWKLYTRIHSVQEEVGSHFSEIDIDNKISAMFTGSSTKTVDGLSKIVFKQLKDKFDIRARSYAELIEEIKLNPTINLELKESLISFFQEIIRISYREENVDETERETLKLKIKSILRKLQ
jgi:hypothetical protein